MITLLIKLVIAALTAYTAYEDHQPLPEPTTVSAPAPTDDGTH